MLRHVRRVMPARAAASLWSSPASCRSTAARQPMSRYCSGPSFIPPLRLAQRPARALFSAGLSGAASDRAKGAGNFVEAGNYSIGSVPMAYILTTKGLQYPCIYPFMISANES